MIEIHLEFFNLILISPSAQMNMMKERHQKISIDFMRLAVQSGPGEVLRSY